MLDYLFHNHTNISTISTFLLNCFYEKCFRLYKLRLMSALLGKRECWSALDIPLCRDVLRKHALTLFGEPEARLVRCSDSAKVGLWVLFLWRCLCEPFDDVMTLCCGVMLVWCYVVLAYCFGVMFTWCDTVVLCCWVMLLCNVVVVWCRCVTHDTELSSAAFGAKLQRDTIVWCYCPRCCVVARFWHLLWICNADVYCWH